MFGWLKKLKKSKSQDVSVDGTAEDALQSCLAQRLAEPNPGQHVATEVCTNRSEDPKRATIAFVRGSSDSKAQVQSSSVRQRPQINVKKLSLSEAQHQYSAASNSPAKSSQATITRSLYPSLDLSSVDKHASKVKRKAPKVKQEEKTIHDIAREIPFAIDPRLQATAKTENKFALLHRNAQPRVQSLKDMLKRCLKYEYDFTREFDLRETYSHVNVYKTLHSFNGVKKCHEMANKPLEYKAANDSKTDPLFQNYYQEFRCYKGKRGDTIECDWREINKLIVYFGRIEVSYC